MNLKLAILVAVVQIACSTALAADSHSKKDTGSKNKPNVTTMKCEEFIALDETIKPKIIYYGVAHARGGKSGNEVIDIEKIDRIVPVVTEVCTKEQKATVWQKLKAEMKKIF
ncbi:HdeA/HdeB family chaperone [Pelotalea chapellei]|uniref:Acid stress chaperone HdeA n=1 Tax=Pelotalea chapellei TaxID=44671 RepID=A0ABS5U3W0_9BACT|nr:HdeA/HdeB family chaperone [Pelotalea chapellei]MBT1070353.1 hypothetical protein [Pelotalea chapellei]